MKAKNYILIGMIIVVVIITGYFIFQDKQNQEIKLCEKYKVGPELELSSLDLYCGGGRCLNTCDENGENCHKVITKEECEKIDIIVIDNNDFVGLGKDGDPDCEWDSSYGCKPNK